MMILPTWWEKPMPYWSILAVLVAIIGGWIALASWASGADTGTVCTRTDHPGVFAYVDIKSVTGEGWVFRRVDQRTVEAWDAGRVVILGGQTRIPYDTIAVLDPRCA